MKSFENTMHTTSNSLSNGCLMRITPLAVWGHKLSSEDLFEAVRLQTAFTHSHPFAHVTCYLYCFAIKHLILGMNSKEVFEMTYNEAKGKYAGIVDSKGKNAHYYLDLVKD